METPVEDLRAELVARRLELLKQVASLEGDMLWLDSNVESEVVEEGQEETVARLLAELDERDRQEVQAIDRTLGRIASGDYGRCAVCGKRIPRKRLQALPTADTCVSCAERSP